LAILGQNETYTLCFLALLPSLSKNRFCATEGADIYRRYKQIQLLKKLEYCSQHNVLHYECYHCQTKIFQPALLLIIFKAKLSSEYVLKQKFKPKYT